MRGGEGEILVAWSPLPLGTAQAVDKPMTAGPRPELVSPRIKFVGAASTSTQKQQQQQREP